LVQQNDMFCVLHSEVLNITTRLKTDKKTAYDCVNNNLY